MRPLNHTGTETTRDTVSPDYLEHIIACSAGLVQAIRHYTLSQAGLWVQVPYWATEAVSPFSNFESLAYTRRLWSVAPFFDLLHVDLDNGLLVDESCKPADDKLILTSAPYPERLDASKVLTYLQKTAETIRKNNNYMTLEERMHLRKRFGIPEL